LEEDWAAARDDALERLEFVQLACSVFLGYARALSGEEIAKIELGRVQKYFPDGAVEPNIVILSLIGRFEQLEGEQQHILPVAEVTGSGIRIRELVDILLLEKAEVGFTLGFLFAKNDLTLAKAVYFEEASIERLECIQQSTTGIHPITIFLWDEFGVRRSERRGATTEALNVGIAGPTIDANNGWHKVEGTT
jgi:hypothetical protein